MFLVFVISLTVLITLLCTSSRHRCPAARVRYRQALAGWQEARRVSPGRGAAVSRRRQNRRRPTRRPLLRRVLTNRYNPGSRWVTLRDMLANARDIWFGFTRRVPPGSRLFYGKDGRIRGYTQRFFR